jgi:hypothetical protein
MEYLEPRGSTQEQTEQALRRARCATLIACLSGLASVVLALVQSRLYVFHPHYLPLCTLYLVLAASTVLAVAYCLWLIIRGLRPVHATILAVIALLPAGFWAYVMLTAQANWQRRWVPNTLTMSLAKVMGATLMRAGADLRYRHRLETDRLVMCYDHLDHPEQDLAAMDQHLGRLEHLLGGPIKAKAYWIRGPMFGVQFASFHGLALGSGTEIPGEYRGDRHELAHVALDWFRIPGSDPPCLLHEGWAMAQCGDGTSELAQAAANSRRESPALGIRVLLGPDWYFRDAGPVYQVGGAFVDFLLRTHGAARFRRFSTECRPDTVEAKCREIFETDLDDLEARFWQDVQKTLGIPPQEITRSVGPR